MSEPLLAVRDLVKRFRPRRGGPEVRAVDGVSFEVAAGEAFGIVGETGSGKSTLARLVCRLLEPDAGSVRFDGRELGGLRRGELKALRREVQMVFQDPNASLNPRMTVRQVLHEPLRVPFFGAALARPKDEFLVPRRHGIRRPSHD